MNKPHKNKSIIEFFFVGTTVNAHFCEKMTCGAGSIAGNNFQLSFVTGLGNLSGREVKVISQQPYPMYPKEKKIWFKTDQCFLNERSKALLIPFINLPVIKQVTVSISIFMALILGLWKNRTSRCCIIVFNVFSPFSLPVLIASKLFGCKSVAIIADLPFNDYDFKGWKGLLQRIDFFVQTNIISKFSGVIALTPKIIEDFALSLPSIVIEGGIDIEAEQAESSRPNKSEYFICLYSGALNEINGISLLLEAFSLISRSDFRLWIFGDGPLSTLVEKAATIDKRIVYWGNVSNHQVKNYQKEATVLINPRPSNNRITYYTFPSKLLEYMLSGRPVISTRLSGIPKDYYNHLIFLENETPKDLANLIEQVCIGETYDIEDMGVKAKEFIESTKNWKYQSKLIYDFLSKL